MKRVLYLIDDYSFKFWEIELLNTSHIKRYCRIGNNVSSKRKEFKNSKLAQKQFEKQIESKFSKGYIEVNSSNNSISENLHIYMQNHNWDYGYGALYKIMRFSECDKGTALMMYWWSSPSYFCQYEDRTQVPSYDLTKYDFVKEIEKNFTSNFYKNSNILFNPRCDTVNYGGDGHDWIEDDEKMYQDLEQKKPIPELMKQPSKKDIEWEAKK